MTFMEDWGPVGRRDVYFKQCRLVCHKDGDPKSCIGVYTAWLPEEFAKVGKVLDLQRGDGSWTYGWTVEEVYTRMSEEYVREHEGDHKTQAKASDKFTPNTGLFKKGKKS